MPRRLQTIALFLAGLLLLNGPVSADNIVRSKILGELRLRGLVKPDATTWDESQWELYWNIRKAEDDGAVDLLARHAPHHYDRYVVEVDGKGAGDRIVLNEAGYYKYRFFKSQDAIPAFEASGVPLKEIFHLTDLTSHPFFDGKGLLTEEGESAYDILREGDRPDWKFDWEPIPATLLPWDKKSEPAEIVALKAGGMEELESEEELWLTKVTVCSDTQLTRDATLRIVHDPYRHEPRYFMSPKDPFFALILRYRSGDRDVTSAVGTPSFGQGRGSLCD